MQAKLVEVDGMQKYEKSLERPWVLEIPKIDLYAEISEGTDKQTLNQDIAHFAETVREDGNIGLAAHNRGYKVNYFEKIKYLEKGDKIFYVYNR